MMIGSRFPRLLMLIIATPNLLRGPWVREISELPLQKKLSLDAPHQVLVQQALLFDHQAASPTSLVFQYSKGFADTAAYNEGVSDAEGEVISAVKRAFEIDQVYCSTSVVDFKLC